MFVINVDFHTNPLSCLLCPRPVFQSCDSVNLFLNCVLKKQGFKINPEARASANVYIFFDLKKVFCLKEYAEPWKPQSNLERLFGSTPPISRSSVHVFTQVGRLEGTAARACGAALAQGRLAG